MLAKFILLLTFINRAKSQRRHRIVLEKLEIFQGLISCLLLSTTMHAAYICIRVSHILPTFEFFALTFAKGSNPDKNTTCKIFLKNFYV